MALTVTVFQRGDIRVVRVQGEVDLNSSPQLRAAILTGVGESTGIGVDLSDIQYMDSSGVATLVEGFKACTAKKLSFLLLSPSLPVMKVLKLARLDSLFRIEDTP